MLTREMNRNQPIYLLNTLETQSSLRSTLNYIFWNKMYYSYMLYLWSSPNLH